jgi:hypothetical protein
MPLFFVINLWLYNRRFLKPKCGLLLSGCICLESYCFNMCDKSIHGPLVVARHLDNNYHLDYEHGS